MNTPHAIFRLLSTYQLLGNPGDDMWGLLLLVLNALRHLLYYAQFSLNLLYIWVLVAADQAIADNQHSTTVRTGHRTSIHTAGTPPVPTSTLAILGVPISKIQRAH